MEGEISPTVDAQYAGSHRKYLGLSGFLRVREDCDTWGTCGVKLTGPHHHLVHLVHLSSPHCNLSTFSQTYVTNQLLL